MTNQLNRVGAARAWRRLDGSGENAWQGVAGAGEPGFTGALAGLGVSAPGTARTSPSPAQLT